MYWDNIKQSLESQLCCVLVRNGWHDVSSEGLRDWSLYEKNGECIRCYVDACRIGFSQSIAGYWIKIEDPAMSSIKRRIKAEFGEGKNGSVIVSFDESKLLTKIAEV